MDRLLRSLFTLADETDAVNDGPPTQGRLVACEVTELAREIVTRHGCAPGPALALTQTTVGAALLSAMIKGEERISVQVVCSGPVGSLLVESTGEGTLRGFPRDPAASAGGRDPESRARAVMGTSGEIHVMRSVDSRIIYQGASSLLRIGLEASFEAYLHQSEQITSAVLIDARVDDAGAVQVARGAMIQAMGGGDRARFRAFVDRLDRKALRERLEAGALDTLGELLPGITHLEPVAERPLGFACLCSRARAASSLLSLGAADLAALKEERGGEVDVDCAFCRTVYRFADIELDAIIEMAHPEAPAGADA